MRSEPRHPLVTRLSKVRTLVLGAQTSLVARAFTSGARFVGSSFSGDAWQSEDACAPSQERASFNQRVTKGCLEFMARAVFGVLVASGHQYTSQTLLHDQPDAIALRF
jgi:hypothetical protein